MKVLSYLCSEKKGTDQLHSKHAADLCLCLNICKTQFFRGRIFYKNIEVWFINTSTSDFKSIFNNRVGLT